jgi:signal transduction histidine kinase
MNIKKRLIFFNSLIILVPILITSIAIAIFVIISSKFFGTGLNYDNFKRASAVKSELITTVKDISKSELKSTDNKEFQEYLKHKLSIINAKAVIAKNDKIIFSSSGIDKIEAQVYIEKSTNAIKEPIQIGNTYYIVDTFPMEFSDSSLGKAIFLTPVKTDGKIFNYFFIFIICVFFTSYLITNIIVSCMFSKKILDPITSLKKATTAIRKGDLDFEIFESGDNEIKELCSNFEEMRIKLKDSINMQLKYDNNRKMLISSISHDLRTPITSIEGYVQGILDGVANTPEKLEHYLNTINTKAKQIDSMVDDLLLYSKLDMKQIPFKFEKTDIVEYFSYYVEETQIELEKSNIKIELLNYIKNSPYVMIDRERFMRVIFNIVNNSKKYMNKKEGIISIILKELSTSIIIEIKDNGSGIKRDDIDKIFNRFYRGDSARVSTGGSGLGLAIARQIVEGHNGKIWASSQYNQGTSIMISIKKVIS